MLLSIIIPTLNEEKILAQTIKTLRQLSICDYEIIVSDGGSTDATLGIARQLADKIITHYGQIRQTIAAGRNAGAARAAGDYLVFLDADVSIPGPNGFFEQALNKFSDDPRLAALTVFIKVFPQSATLSDKFFFSLVNLQMRISNNVFHHGAAAGEFQMIRKSAFEKVGGYNAGLAVAEDNDLFSRLSKTGRTYAATGLHVYHTSRRAHQIGWPKLLLLWWLNLLFSRLLRRSYSKEWTVIR